MYTCDFCGIDVNSPENLTRVWQLIKSLEAKATHFTMSLQSFTETKELEVLRDQRIVLRKALLSCYECLDSRDDLEEAEGDVLWEYGKGEAPKNIVLSIDKYMAYPSALREFASFELATTDFELSDLLLFDWSDVKQLLQLDVTFSLQSGQKYTLLLLRYSHGAIYGVAYNQSVVLLATTYGMARAAFDSIK